MACASCNSVYDRLASRSASGVLYDPWASEYQDIVRGCGCETECYGCGAAPVHFPVGSEWGYCCRCAECDCVGGAS